MGKKCWVRSQLGETQYRYRLYYKFINRMIFKNMLAAVNKCAKTTLGNQSINPPTGWPFHGFLFPVKRCGNLMGRMTASFSASLAALGRTGISPSTLQYNPVLLNCQKMHEAKNIYFQISLWKKYSLGPVFNIKNKLANLKTRKINEHLWYK